MKRPKRFHAAGPTIVIAMLAGIVAVGAAVGVVAQPGEESVALPLADVELTVDAPWSIDRGATVATEDANVVKLDGETDNVLLGYFPAGTSVEEADAAIVGPYVQRFDAVEVIESGTSGDYAYGLNLVTIAGREYGVFSLYTSEGVSGFAEASVYIAPVTGFGAGLDDAKQDILVDGEPIFGGVQGDGVQAVLSDATGASAAVTVTGPPLPSSGGGTPVASPAATPTG